jgi:hypothetical protein
MGLSNRHFGAFGGFMNEKNPFLPLVQKLSEKPFSLQKRQTKIQQFLMI